MLCPSGSCNIFTATEGFGEILLALLNYMDIEILVSLLTQRINLIGLLLVLIILVCSEIFDVSKKKQVLNDPKSSQLFIRAKTNIKTSCY